MIRIIEEGTMDIENTSIKELPLYKQVIDIYQKHIDLMDALA